MSHTNINEADTSITIVHDDHAQVPVVTFSPTTTNNNLQATNSTSAPPKPNTDRNANDAEVYSSAPLNTQALSLGLESLEGQQALLLGTNGNRQIPNVRNDTAQILEYQTEYPIIRFTRKWKRPEVQGLCCLAIEVTCLVTLAVLGLQAVGYIGANRYDTHLPLTFSWKVLWEFFSNTSLPKKLIECLFANLGGKIVVHEDENYGGLDSIGPIDVNYVLLETFSPTSPENEPHRSSRSQRMAPIPERSLDSHLCEFRSGRHSLSWLIKFFVSGNFMPTLNVITSTILFTSLTIRRRKGMQVLLLLPSFFCFFISVFQQIPISFQYNYFDQSLVKEMRQTLIQSNPPFYIVPILDETQVHHQCCGVEYPETWEAFGQNVYPPSCCNTTAFNCTKLDTIRREHVWSIGCLHVEHEKIHSFERWALFLYALKVVAEVGIFCTLSDLTRIDYPAPEVQETSRCDFRDYQIKCRGVMHIKGVTKDGRIVTEVKALLAWRLIPSRTDLLHGIQLYVKTENNQIKGSVEILKRFNNANFLQEDIQVDLSRKNRGIFVFTLT